MAEMELCSKCGRERPRVITDPNCTKSGYCNWTMYEIAQSLIERPKPSSLKRENTKQALEYLVNTLNPSATSEQKFSAAVAIDMLLDALEL